jgi:hypothetical protein
MHCEQAALVPCVPVGCVPAGQEGPENGKPLPLLEELLLPPQAIAAAVTTTAAKERRAVVMVGTLGGRILARFLPTWSLRAANRSRRCVVGVTSAITLL